MSHGMRSLGIGAVVAVIAAGVIGSASAQTKLKWAHV